MQMFGLIITCFFFKFLEKINQKISISTEFVKKILSATDRAWG